jgi:carbon-monoxide dehydrogenase medium subunit
MKPPAFGYARPDSLPAALAAMKQGGGQVRPLAGGQSLMPMLNLRLSRPGTVMDLSLLADMRGVIRRDDAVDLGALTTHAELEDGLLHDFAGGYLTRVASGIAYRAIRNHGTVAGSLAHADPAADWPVALSALDARVLVANAAGQR